MAPDLIFVSEKKKKIYFVCVYTRYTHKDWFLRTKIKKKTVLWTRRVLWINKKIKPEGELEYTLILPTQASLVAQ